MSIPAAIDPDTGLPVEQPPAPVVPPEPDWDFGTQQPAAPAPLTEDSLRNLVRQELQGFRPQQQQYDDPEDAELAQIAAIQWTDPVQAEKKRLAILERRQQVPLQQMQQQMAAAMAPTVREQMATQITRGLSEAARQDMLEYFSGYDVPAMAKVAVDKRTLDKLRDAAENFDRRRNGNGVVAPTSEGTSTPTQHLDPGIERQIDLAWEKWKTIPGMTKEALRKTFMEESNG